ncbi:7562_t:CDS:1, partial [Dentiscutata erythropus]
TQNKLINRLNQRIDICFNYIQQDKPQQQHFELQQDEPTTTKHIHESSTTLSQQQPFDYQQGTSLSTRHNHKFNAATTLQQMKQTDQSTAMQQ